MLAQRAARVGSDDSGRIVARAKAHDQTLPVPKLGVVVTQEPLRRHRRGWDYISFAISPTTAMATMPSAYSTAALNHLPYNFDQVVISGPFAVR
jgi:hypothetical protein